MEIKLINAAYQDKKQMKHAKTTSYPQKGKEVGGASFLQDWLQLFLYC